MARVVMIGGGVVGLTAALLLAKDGHAVTILERDPAPAPDPDVAWDEWERRGVNQFRMLHFFQPRFRAEMAAAAPEVLDALVDAGALRLNMMRLVPDEMSGGYRDSDDEFEAITARRPIAEAAIARCADAAGVTVRRGAVVTALLTGEPKLDGVPHVVGVRTADGEDVHADLVVDVSGRRSSLPSLLADVGARSPLEEKDDCGFVYYGRHFRSDDGSTPAIFGPLLMSQGSISALTLPADNGTWGLGLVASGRDAPLRALTDVDTWERVVRALPLVAHWLDGEPIDEGVAVMAKLEDRHRTFVVDGTPVATGVVALADSWACTNPSVGRGITIGAIHAVVLRDLFRSAPADPVAQALAWHEATLATAEPWYRGTLDFDRGRLAEIHAIVDGVPFEPDPVYEITRALQTASGQDPELFRGMLELGSVLALPEEVLARPGNFEKIIELGSGWRDVPDLAPTRDQLLELVG